MQRIHQSEFEVSGIAIPNTLRGKVDARELRFRRLGMRLTAILLGCVVSLILAEVTLRIFQPHHDRYYIWKPNHSATLSPMPGVMPGVGPIARMQVNSQGIIGSEWSADRSKEYRVLTVGGSTTECLYLDKNRTWAAQLQQGLELTADGRKVLVGNVGKAGFNTRDHLAFMQLALDQYDVDAIVMLVGANDMIHRLMQGASYEPNFVEDETRYREWLITRFAIVPSSVESQNKSFFKKTALWRMGQELRRIYRARNAPIVQDDAGDWLVRLRKLRSEAMLTDELPSLDSGLDEYERNLTAIIQAARLRSIRIVFMTQPTIWKTTMPEPESRLLWMGWRPDGKYYTTAAMKKAMDSYNARLLDICRRFEVECLDLANRLPPTTDVFYDDMHFNESGARSVSDAVTSFFRMRPPFAATSASTQTE